MTVDPAGAAGSVISGAAGVVLNAADGLIGAAEHAENLVMTLPKEGTGLVDDTMKDALARFRKTVQQAKTDFQGAVGDIAGGMPKVG